MNTPSDADLLAKWRARPAPLLPLLHDFHERDGFLSEASLRAISEDLRIPIADLFGTVTFYHHFSRNPEGYSRARVCTGPICALAGADGLLAGLPNAQAMPCPGRCDEPIPVLDRDRVLCGTTAAELSSRPSPLPPAPHADIEECVFAHIRTPGRATLAGYRATGGYAGLENALRGRPGSLLDVIDASGLAGRGGAGFPTGRKWRAVAEAAGEPKTIVCNADEGEPGCFKDRALMDYDPHAVIEGMIAAGFATGATRGFIYLRYEYPDTLSILETALEEARGAGLLGPEARGPGRPFDLWVRRGAGAYICGEETSLLNSLEGKHPFPRNRPPFPVTHGYEDLPTVVNNVETLASVPHILVHGADWYRGLGIGDHAGTKVISLSGDVTRPGNYEVPMGFPLMTLIDDWAGGVPGGRKIQAVTMAGLSGGFLAGDDLEVTLDEPDIRSKGSFLGAGGIMVFDDSRDMIEVAHSAMEFFAEESCGKCFPCRIGTQRLTERLHGEGPPEVGVWIDEVHDLGDTMMQTSACGLGQAAPLITESLIRYFPDRVSSHVTESA
ncbi:NADH-ubiquinone oxidoreductase-F iron-sulfur binding region domain-containing protein [Candidatus Palauibacter soopunensis]|uniref:NADH-ubiquinone oxidoreductase-F iron-sulfur binding region domain-containing protein n=1 Tax=Candidatus Palauibacter soopunensis TaxID=3056739 RepID=UPI0023A1CF56|nr:NADH-ubiquinone oxidoreductase-F iron-sulfur binding region domain-containing protein [Candidatus Palauibacter soopunensis]MDE2877488.1 NAD(P)H-dependent oxidoreductase subunit E [Candidatus Palauibacter soopunensis]